MRYNNGVQNTMQLYSTILTPKPSTDAEEAKNQAQIEAQVLVCIFKDCVKGKGDMCIMNLLSEPLLR